VGRALFKQRLERENARLNALIPLYDLSRLFMSSTDLSTIPQRVVSIARQEMGADRASLMLAEGEDTLVMRAAEGLPDQALAEPRQPTSQGIAGYVYTHREPVILQGDRAGDARFEPALGESAIASAISLPRIHQDRGLGVLNVAKPQEGAPFTEADVELLAVLANQAAVAIENARLFAEIEDAYRRVSELDHLKSEFIGIAAHELRAPLAILLAYATIIEDEATGPMREHLTQVVDSAMQLKSIIDEMVSLRRIDTGTAQVQRTAIALAPVAQAVLVELDPLVRQKELALTVSLPCDLPAVLADEQVLALISPTPLQRHQFTPPARCRDPGRRGAGWGGGGTGDGYGRGYPHGGARAHFRPFLSGGKLVTPRARGHRPGPGHRP
jgi:signal transduction histidine kinase